MHVQLRCTNIDMDNMYVYIYIYIYIHNTYIIYIYIYTHTQMCRYSYIDKTCRLVSLCWKQRNTCQLYSVFHLRCNWLVCLKSWGKPSARCDVRLRGCWGHCRGLLGLDRHWRLSDDGPTRCGETWSFARDFLHLLGKFRAKPLNIVIGFLDSWFWQMVWLCLIVVARNAFLACCV